MEQCLKILLLQQACSAADCNERICLQPHAPVHGMPETEHAQQHQACWGIETSITTSAMLDADDN
jgi:hypothetical protein